MKLLILIMAFFATSLTNIVHAKSKKCEYAVGELYCAHISFTGKISRKQDSSFLLKITDRQGKITPLDRPPKVWLWMVMKSGHGHGSDDVKISPHKTSGYLIENVWLLMMGTWQIKGEIAVAGKKYSFYVPVCVGKSAKDGHLGKCKL